MTGRRGRWFLERRQPVANSKNPKRFENFFPIPRSLSPRFRLPKVVIYKSPGDVNPSHTRRET